MNNAPFHTDLAEGPEASRAFWSLTEDDVRIRVGIFPAEAENRGTVLLCLGRFGYVERYGRVAKMLAQEGFTTVVPEWRSQGLSDRMGTDPRAGHVDTFDDYQKDLRATRKIFADLQLPGPVHLLGISMGACIGLRGLIEELQVQSAAFLCPMWGIRMSFVQRGAAWPLSWAAHHCGFGQRFVPGEGPEIYVLNTDFEDNILTRNTEMWDYWVRQAEAKSDLQIGGPTMSWLYSALVECKRLSNLHSPDLPCLTFCSTDDHLVDNAATRARMKQWKDSVFIEVKDAKHDLLTELPPVGPDVTQKITQFFVENQKSPAVWGYSTSPLLDFKS